MAVTHSCDAAIQTVANLTSFFKKEHTLNFHLHFRHIIKVAVSVSRVFSFAEVMGHCHPTEIAVESQFKQLRSSPKKRKVFGASTGFEPVASASREPLNLVLASIETQK